MSDKIKGDYKSLDPIQDAMGDLGRWQIIIFIAISLMNFPPAWRQLSNGILNPDKTNFTCIHPGATNFSDDNCMAYVNETLYDCQKFQYTVQDFKRTYVIEWDLVCKSELLSPLTQALTMLAILIGNMVFGMLADKIGRKTPLMIAVVIQSLAGVASAYMPTYSLFATVKFISDVATGGTMLISFVILMEIVGSKWRSKISMLFQSSFLLGCLSVSLVAYLTRTWDQYTLITSALSVILWSYYWLVPESPRWLLTVGKVEQARKILRKAAKQNGISLEKVAAAIESHENQSNKEISDATTVSYGVIDLFKTPNLRRTTFCLVINWMAGGFNFFGMGQYVGQVEGYNIYINYAISTALLLPSLLVVYILVDRVSRLKMLMTGNIIAGVSILLMIYFAKSPVQIYLASLGLSGSMVTFVTLYLYTGEVYPTVVRNSGMALCSLSSKFASMAAPFITYIGVNIFWAPLLFYGLIILIGAALCIFLPETIGIKLPDTIEEAENFGRKEEQVELESVRL